MSEPKSGILLFGHGARNAAYAEPFERIRAAMLARDPHAQVEIGFLELSRPTFEDALAALADRGVVHVKIVPIFFAPGRHPDLEIEVVDAVGMAPAVIEAMAEFALTSSPR
jgi:sirohydrochlorin cobaltochelatase